jgi:hypothetical protein
MDARAGAGFVIDSRHCRSDQGRVGRCGQIRWLRRIDAITGSAAISRIQDSVMNLR